MPYQNRVTPLGTLEAAPQRGTLTGNRGGPLHDAEGRIVRLWHSRQWISCELEFRGRRAQVMAPGRYTHLFFLDEVTALAAGHRPCGQCRHGGLSRFLEAFRLANRERLPDTDLARVPAVDTILHHDRVEGTPRLHRKRTYRALVDDLPDGTMFLLGDVPHVRSRGDVLMWSAGRYGRRLRCPAEAEVEVLTPRSITETLAAGYQPRIHSSAR